MTRKKDKGKKAKGKDDKKEDGEDDDENREEIRWSLWFFLSLHWLIQSLLTLACSLLILVSVCFRFRNDVEACRSNN